MKIVKAESGQTIWDIALQEIGSVEAVFDILDVNPDLQLDQTIPVAYPVRIPSSVISPRVVDYYLKNKTKPVSGLDYEAIVTQNDMNTQKQDLDYSLAGGDHMFASVRLFFLHDMLSVQIVYEDIDTDTVVVSVDQSLDGVNWSMIPFASQVLDKDKPNHTFNIVGLLTDFVRLHVEVPDASTGTLKSVTWKT
jgi:hypothetical protein